MERKQLLGAVFDEIEHYFKLFTVERNAYLALSGVAAACLVAGVVVLAVRPGAGPAIAVTVLGGSGLVAFAAGRSSAFFHSTIKMIEELVKRYSKLSEPDMVSSVAVLKKRSETSLLLMLIGAAAVSGSVIFAFVRTQAIEHAVGLAQEEAARAQTEAATWKASFAGAQHAYTTLKSAVTTLYPAHVTREHSLVEVRATAQRVAGKPGKGTTATFTLALHASPETLSSIKRVRYQVRYPGLEEHVFTSDDAATGFRTSYAGANCLSAIDVTLEMQSGPTDALTFDQCAIVGSQWAPVATIPAAAAPAR